MEIAVTDKQTGITRKIKKAKLNTNMCVDVEFEEIEILYAEGSDEPIEKKGIVPYKGKNIVHQDLIDAFGMFKSHMAILSESADSVGITFHDLDQNEDILEKYNVESIELSTAGSADEVKITGEKKLKNEGYLPVKLPFVSLINLDGEGYENADELNATVSHWYSELELYVNKGKIAPSAQMNLFEQEQNDIEEE